MRGDPAVGKYIRANGLDVYYLEAGSGDPLLLLHGGTMSARRSWSEHLLLFARYYRVIAPDARGHGNTFNPSGHYSYPLLADDVVALSEALALDRPLICGFSNGGIVASLIAMRQPTLVRALVSAAGYDLFHVGNYERLREVFGGDPHALVPDLDGFERRYPDWVARMRQDHDATQGQDHWRTLIRQAWPMWSQPMNYTFDDFRRVLAPMLIMVGDRDEFCSVEEALTVYRLLSHGELAILPNMDHAFDALAAQLALAFLLRHSSRQEQGNPGQS